MNSILMCDDKNMKKIYRERMETEILYEKRIIKNKFSE